MGLRSVAPVQRALTLGGLAVAALWFLAWMRVDRPGVAVAGAAAVCLLHAVVLALEFVLMAHANRREAVPQPTLGEIVRAWAAETVTGWRVFCWHQPFASARHPDHLPDPADPARRGVLLVHGFVCNRGLWNGWMVRLRTAGVPHVAVNLEPVYSSLDAYAGLVEAAVQRLERATGLPPVVVAHSMGGLVVRRWLVDAGLSRVHHVITLGTPHHGTELARWALSINARQMRRDSRWLQALRERETEETGRRFTCFHSHCDNIVFPALTATLPGADNRHLAGVAHVQMTEHPQPLQVLWQRLDREGG
jgi:triacylglycerol esterase/lipase EstA (alpha/beta hydrolase family)